MQTPRFSGQPANAGDFVFVRIPSRPILTSCANVGTVFPRMARLSRSGIPSRRHPEDSLRPRVESERPRLEQAPKRKTRKCAHVSHRRSPCAQTTLANAHYAERFTANPETSKNSARTPRGRTTLLASESERLTRLCGTGVPYPAAPRFHSVLLCSGSEDPSNCSLPRDTACRVPRSYRYY